MADAPLTYGIVIGVFVGLGAILFAEEQKGFRVSMSHAWIRVLLNRNVHPRKRETALTGCYSLLRLKTPAL